MHALHVRREVPGHLTDRLQEAMWREILHMVNDGVATTGELDESIIYGPGLRWAAMGTNLIYHLAGGESGMRHMLEQFGPCLKWPWTKLEAPELTDPLIDRMVEGTQAQAQGRSIRELERLRDDYLVAIQQVLRQSNIGAGATLRALEQRLYADYAGAQGERGCRGRHARAAPGSGAARVDRLQRPHDRFALPSGLRRCHGCAVAVESASTKIIASVSACTTRSKRTPRTAPSSR